MTPTRDALVDKMNALAKSYVPEWSFTEKEPDAGSVVALLYKDMLQDSAQRYLRVLQKHKIQYLNLFDRFKEEPVESAKSFVCFQPVAGAPEPVHVPKGTRLFADSDKTDGQIVFETTHGITVTPAECVSIYTTDGKAGVISPQFDAERHQALEKHRFTAFQAGEENLEEHVLLLGFGDSFEHLDTLDIELMVATMSEDEVGKTIESLCSGDIEFSVLCEGGFERFDKAEPTHTGLRLQKERFAPGCMTLAGAEHCVVAITARALCDMQLSGVKLRFAREDIIPDEVRCGGIAQNPEHFRLFGAPMEIFAACEIESKTVFARRGAKVDVSFKLDFEIIEQLLPEYEVEEEYKVIMKRPPAQQRPVVSEVRADYVLLEYLSETGWKRLVREEHATLLFNGSEQGEMRISFTMPADILSGEDAGGAARMRLRLLRADNLYRIPCRQHCPVIDHLRFSYSYQDNPQRPGLAVTRNNFEQNDVTGLFERGHSVTLFYSKEHEKPAMYFGFNTHPWGTPVSIYFDIEDNADYPVDFTAEYLAPNGFLPLKVVDGTAGMLGSGTLLMVIPQDCVKGKLFGQEHYWLRLINHNKENKPYNLPVITGIHRNMAGVENVRTQTEYFYPDRADGDFAIQLGEQGLISAKVYVNEEDGLDGENWVLWQKAEHRQSTGRVYDIDLAAGRIVFGRGAFSTFPAKETGPAVMVRFQSYHGSSANVDAGKITMLESSIRHIAEVSNPLPAYGGYDGFTEETSACIISNMLRTRGRAVSRQDFFDIIAGISYGVKRIKCVSGINLKGEPQEDAVTIAILIGEYDKGGHIFSGAKEAIREKLLDCSSLLPAGKTLILTQPRFVRMSTRLWIECERMENAYDLQKQCRESIHSFIDPLCGGFDGAGWEIGTLPTPTQLVAFLKIRQPDIMVSKIVMTAVFENREYEVDDSIARKITSPIAMAVNGEHVVYSRLV